ncbi:MAG: outer membrane beta-barrel protein [Bacteroidetes bacterium]|nr:outer membrane beta-barrel protein [Bacteroidota bacterium]
MKNIKIFVFFLLLCNIAQAQKYLMEIDVNKDTIPSKIGNKRLLNYAVYLGYSMPLANSVNNPSSKIKYLLSYSLNYGFWFRYKMSKVYSIGSSIEYYRDEYNMKNPYMGDSLFNYKIKTTKQISNNAALSVFNRFNFLEDYFFVETALFCAYDFYPKITTKATPDTEYKTIKTTYFAPDIINRFNYGATFKITYDFASVYARYRFSGLYKNKNYDLPKFSLGIMFDIKD